MPQQNQLYKSVDIAPLTGPMDTRASPDQVPFGGWRMLQNMETRQERELYRASGWEKYLNGANYNNADLHDQLTSLTDGSSKEPITFLYETISRNGFTRLIAGTPRRLFALDNSRGNWKIISDELGEKLNGSCLDWGWSAGQVDNTVVFSNSVDKPIYWNFDAPSDPDSGQSTDFISDLDDIGVTSAKIVISFKGLIILMNVIQEGLRYPMRIITSDLNNPLSFVPKQDESAATQAELGTVGDSILAAVPIADSIFIYTTQSIWEMFLSGNINSVVEFKRRYHAGPSGDKCLAFHKTVVSTGAEHFYMGAEGIYRYSLHDTQPDRVDWIHRATGDIYKDINSGECNAHVGGYDPHKKTVYFSWAQAGASCPTKSIGINIQYGLTSFIDHGFSAYLSAHPDNPTTLRQLLTDNCICSDEDLEEHGLGDDRQGVDCNEPVEVECESYPEYLFGPNTIEVDGVVIEDYNQTPHPNSICAKLNALDLNNLCDQEFTSDECRAERVFVGVSSTDQCLKQFTDVYFRERCTQFTPCGVYVEDGYKSIMRSGAMDFKDPQHAKNFGRLILEAFAEDATNPSLVALRVGAAFQAADPNLDKCALVWFNQIPKRLKCVSEVNGEDHLKAHTRPALGIEWPLFVENIFLYFELSIDGVGGASHFSRVGLEVRKKNRY